MKKIFMTIASVAMAFCAIIGSASAQTRDANSTYNLQKAYEILQEDGDEEEALKLLNEQITSTPDNAEAYYLRSHIYRNQFEYGRALSDLNQALKCNKPKKTGLMTSAIYWWKGTVYCFMEDYESALAEYRTSLDFARKEKSENIETIYYGIGQCLYYLKRYDESDDFYRKMLSEDETDVYAMTGLARNMIERKDYSSAIEILTKAEKFSGDYSEIYHLRMEAYDKMGETDKAIDDALTYYNVDEDASASEVSDYIMKHKNYGLAKAKAKMAKSDEPLNWYLLLISVYESCGEYEKAIAEYNKVEEDFGKDTFIYLKRSQDYDELGLTDIALSEMDKCLETSSSAYVIASKADILRGVARYEEAIKLYEDALEKSPDSAYEYYAMGWCYELMGNEERALELYNEGIDIDKDYPYIYLMRGELYQKQGKDKEAKDDFEVVLQKDTIAEPGSCRMYALHSLGKDDEALEWMKKIIEANPYDSGEMYDQACLYARMGRCEESVKALEKAFEMGYCGFEHIRHDDDMDSIRDREDFKALIEKYEAKLAEKIEKMNLKSAEETETRLTEVPITRHVGGTFNVDCTINGLPLSMIFDTGASDVTLSKVEADFMFKNNYISQDDIKGKKYYQVADGGITEGTVVTLKELKIGDAVLHNVDASVVKSQKAPLLLGESVMQKFGTFTVDNINNKLIIKH